MISKLIILPNTLNNLWSGDATYRILILSVPFDIIVTPVVIQFSYLCANKRNAQSFDAMLLEPFRYVWNMLMQRTRIYPNH
ncbi:unnamed protein product [Caenorhabditis sp. 36 PRJEB53466]|nr:unnamed protein product [Caenorhabditis sp. 36 PRJEB53466]